MSASSLLTAIAFFFPTQFEIFLVLGMMSDFHLKPVNCSGGGGVPALLLPGRSRGLSSLAKKSLLLWVKRGAQFSLWYLAAAEQSFSKCFLSGQAASFLILWLQRTDFCCFLGVFAH